MDLVKNVGFFPQTTKCPSKCPSQGQGDWEPWRGYLGLPPAVWGCLAGTEPIKRERREQQIASCKPWRSIPKSGDLHTKIESILAFRNQTNTLPLSWK